MILIEEILVSDEIIEEHFMCNLSACKGACCWEGDWGAPLNDEEVEKIYDILDEILPFLPERSQAFLDSKDPTTYFKELGQEGTSLHPDGACIFLTYDGLGIAKCGIEHAYFQGKTDFRKPISCHLYPIRVQKNEMTGFEAMNYDRWDICSAACSKGKTEKIRLYQFAKDAIIRAYGQTFYDQLDAAALHLEGED